MTSYTITIEGYRSGLTEKTVEQQFREMYGRGEVEITVEEE